MMSDDSVWMRRCLEAALRGRGRVSPNPMVGAVIVRKGRLLAEGHHARYGGDHAEVAALKRAGRRARGATLYVSLEPCAHRGKTPPCAPEIVRSGVLRVVAAMRDPHPLVNGRGIRALRAAGIQVQVGAMGPAARELNRAYVTTLKRGRPLVTLKAGMTLDGMVATSTGDSRWITSAASRRDAHRLRSEHDAILVGIGTALADRPRLDARPHGRHGRQPMRVVLDSGLRLEPGSPMLRVRGAGPVIVYAARKRGARARRLEASGALVVNAGRGPGGVDPRRVLRDLASRGVHSLLVEGGSRVAGTFLNEGLVDQIVFYVAPLILGGEGSIPVVRGKAPLRIGQAIRLRAAEVRRMGPDFLVTGRPAPRASRLRGPGR